MKQVVAVLLVSTCLAGTARGSVEALESIQAGVSGLYQAVSGYGIELDSARARTAAVDAVLESIDPKGRRLSESELSHARNEQLGQDYAIGVTLTMSNGLPVIASVIPETPAAVAGIKPGQVITAIDDRQLSPAPMTDALAALRGHATNSVRLSLHGPGSETSAVDVARALLAVPAVEVTEVLPSSIVYVKINGLYAGAGDLLAASLKGWDAENHAGAILDLRGAGGIDAAEAAAVARVFADKGGMLFAFRDRHDQDAAVQRAGEGDPVGLPVMVLVDGETAGASEVLAATMKGSVRGALLIGRTTKGDPLIREPVLLPDGDFAYIAVKRLVTADGAVFDGASGVSPDIVVGNAATPEEDFEPEASPDRRATLEEELIDRALRNRVRGDTVLRRAVDITLGLKALDIRSVGALPDDTTP